MRHLTIKTKKAILQAVLVAIILIVSSIYSANAQALLQIGAQAPEFSLKDINGKESGLSSYSNKKAVIILFWSTWSSKSMKALKRFDEFQRKYNDKGIQVIGINAENQTISNEDTEKIKNIIKELDLSFPVLLDRGLNTFHSYSVIALPSTIVVSDGKIVYELPGLPLVGTEDMFDYLLVLAGEPPRKEKAPKYMPKHDAIADTNLGRGFVKKKMNLMAYPLFKKALEKDPKYMLPYIELANLHELDGNAAEAEETLKKALSIESENVVAMSELGYMYVKHNKLKEAVEILEKAAKLNSYTPSHYYFAYALGKSGQMKEALNAFEIALSLNPFEPAIYLLRAELYENNKMLKEASSDYRKALELILKIANQT